VEAIVVVAAQFAVVVQVVAAVEIVGAQATLSLEEEVVVFLQLMPQEAHLEASLRPSPQDPLMDSTLAVLNAMVCAIFL
jgi:hypothetical protein